MVSLWAFGQLQDFIRYKAAAKGIRVTLVDPAYTSLECHQCHKMGKRVLDLFTCATCGEFDADINSAMNIAAGGAGAGDIPAYGNAA